MKNSILAIILMAFVMVSCNQKNKQDDTINNSMMQHDSTMMMSDSTMIDDNSHMNDTDAKVYACPMHPEITGKKGDTCSECGMELTKEVK